MENSRGSEGSAGSLESPNPNRVFPKKKKALKTTNAYFYWVTREQGSFDWFKGVMNEVADLDQRVIRRILSKFNSVSCLLQQHGKKNRINRDMNFDSLV